jgi:hypothetical protein
MGVTGSGGMTERTNGSVGVHSKYRTYPNVRGFECLGDTVLGYPKHLMFTVLGAGLAVFDWCSILGEVASSRSLTSMTALIDDQ